MAEESARLNLSLQQTQDKLIAADATVAELKTQVARLEVPI